MSAAEPPQSANCAPSGGSEAAEPRAWGDHTSVFDLRGILAFACLLERTRRNAGPGDDDDDDDDEVPIGDPPDDDEGADGDDDDDDDEEPLQVR